MRNRLQMLQNWQHFPKLVKSCFETNIKLQTTEPFSVKNGCWSAEELGPQVVETINLLSIFKLATTLSKQGRRCGGTIINYIAQNSLGVHFIP